jgi:anaerobic selenocysteine-containing dehydrogenase
MLIQNVKMTQTPTPLPLKQTTEGTRLQSYPPSDRWDNWVEYDPKAWPRRIQREYMLVPTICFNCESACGLLGYVDKQTMQVQKFEGNPAHPGSRGRNCAKGPATLNQVQDPDRILYPMKRAGKRGEGKWVRISWEQALKEIGGRLRKAFQEQRHNEVIYHVGRPGHDGVMEWVLMGWGCDSHNSHTNICSSSARAGYGFWMGYDRPSPDHAKANVIFLISSHLETGHYFNPHAQRIIEGKLAGAKLIVLDTRLSNTASMADAWLSPWPGSEAAILLAIANYLITNEKYDREFVKKWVNWEEYLQVASSDQTNGSTKTARFEEFEEHLKQEYVKYTFEFAAKESGVEEHKIRQIAEWVANCGGKLAAHTWRSATAGNLGGWSVARCLFFLNVLTGSVGVEGGTSANAWDKWVPRMFRFPSHPKRWNEMTWPREYALNYFEMSILLPHFLKEGRGKLDTYFTRVYNPMWTNPDGFTWLEALKDENKIGCHVALTPTWNESAWWADYVLPMGHGSERHDLMSQETHAGQWLAFRQPVMRVAMERMGKKVEKTYQANPGQVWEEHEFWIDLSWEIDPDGSMGIRQTFESPYRPGEKITMDEYHRWVFENSVPGLPDEARKHGLTALQYMRKFGAYEIRKGAQTEYSRTLSENELANVQVDEATKIIYTKDPVKPAPNIVPRPAPVSSALGRATGVMIGGEAKFGFLTPSRKLEFYSKTLAEWGWSEYALPSYIHSHVHQSQIDRENNEFVLISTYRLPTLIHTRSANAKWLVEISHSNPTWVHTSDAKQLGVKTGDLVRVETEIGYFVDKVWVTEGIRPGVVACSHHLGRWRLHDGEGTNRISSALVDLSNNGEVWNLRQLKGIAPFKSDDPDTARIWWTDAGVHQNLTFPVQPDPISGMHCWHQKVRVIPAQVGDKYGDIHVDTAKSHEVYKRWLAMTRPPKGDLRRPHWMLRPFRPELSAYKLSQ